MANSAAIRSSGTAARADVTVQGFTIYLWFDNEALDAPN